PWIHEGVHGVVDDRPRSRKAGWRDFPRDLAKLGVLMNADTGLFVDLMELTGAPKLAPLGAPAPGIRKHATRLKIQWLQHLSIREVERNRLALVGWHRIDDDYWRLTRNGSDRPGLDLSLLLITGVEIDALRTPTSTEDLVPLYARLRHRLQPPPPPRPPPRPSIALVRPCRSAADHNQGAACRRRVGALRETLAPRGQRRARAP